jgi:aminoglycoside 3-N-acetyltransferase I
VLDLKLKKWSNIADNPLISYTKTMQKIATRLFIYSSIAFGVIGILVVWTLPGQGDNGSDLHTMLMKLLFATVFIILPSFALSIASKYLNGKS